MFRWRTTCLSALLLALIVLSAPLPALAQDPLTERYVSPSGVSFSYPAGWVFMETGGVIALINDLAAFYAGELPPGTVGVIVMGPAALGRMLTGPPRYPDPDRCGVRRGSIPELWHGYVRAAWCTGDSCRGPFCGSSGGTRGHS